MYEILGKDNPYPKAKVLIRDIGEFNKAGVRLIKADMDAMFAAILAGDSGHVPTVATVHHDAYEAIDAMLQGRPAGEQLDKLRGLAAVVNQKIEGIERLESRNGLTPVA
jgi:hypothetical protein